MSMHNSWSFSMFGFGEDCNLTSVPVRLAETSQPEDPLVSRLTAGINPHLQKYCVQVVPDVKVAESECLQLYLKNKPKKCSIVWKDELEEVLTKRHLKGASGFIVRHMESHLLLAFYNNEIDGEDYAVVRIDFVQGLNDVNAEDQNLIYRKVRFNAVSLRTPVHLLYGGQYSWMAKEVILTNEFEDFDDAGCQHPDPFSSPDVPNGSFPIDTYIEIGLICIKDICELFFIYKDDIKYLMELTSCLEMASTVRYPIKSARYNKLYSAYVSDFDLEINGRPITKQQRDGKLGNWVRILVTAVDESRCQLRATLIDWGRTNIRFHFNEVVPLQFQFASFPIKTRRGRLYKCRPISLDDLSGFPEPESKLLETSFEVKKWMTEMSKIIPGFFAAAFKSRDTIVLDLIGFGLEGIWNVSQSAVAHGFASAITEEDCKDFLDSSADPELVFNLAPKKTMTRQDLLTEYRSE